jgi:hypothetical protein
LSAVVCANADVPRTSNNKLNLARTMSSPQNELKTLMNFLSRSDFINDFGAAFKH